MSCSEPQIAVLLWLLAAYALASLGEWIQTQRAKGEA